LPSEGEAGSEIYPAAIAAVHAVSTGAGNEDSLGTGLISLVTTFDHLYIGRHRHRRTVP
jgi:hypothetical protein